MSRSEVRTYLRHGQPFINFAHYFYDFIKADPFYARFLVEVKPEEYEKVRTWDGQGSFVIKLHNCPVKQIAIEEQKGVAGLLFNVSMGEVKSPSFLKIFAGLKQIRIVPKAKVFFGGKEISDIQIGGTGVPGLSAIANDQKLHDTILNLFKTNLVEIFQISYVKDQTCMIITSIKRELEVIEKTDFPENWDYLQVTKRLVDVAMSMAKYIQEGKP